MTSPLPFPTSSYTRIKTEHDIQTISQFSSGGGVVGGGSNTPRDLYPNSLYPNTQNTNSYRPQQSYYQPHHNTSLMASSISHIPLHTPQPQLPTNLSNITAPTNISNNISSNIANNIATNISTPSVQGSVQGNLSAVNALAAAQIAFNQQPGTLEHLKQQPKQDEQEQQYTNKMKISHSSHQQLWRPYWSLHSLL